MSKQKPRSLQDILKSRRQEEFVGREEQLVFFRRNLHYKPDDGRRRFVISVFGQGGMGKTWLLRRLRKIAEEFGVITAYTDETEDDVPGVMGRIAEQFEAQGHTLKTFAERYKVYRQRWQDIMADPKVPPPFLEPLARGIVRAARRIPFAGIAAEFVEEEPFAERVSKFAAYVAGKFGGREEARLVLEPVEILTPLFLADLRKVVEKHPIALFFDTYERTGDLLDPWLRDLLEGRHGDVPANILLVVAGRDELNRNYWAPYGGLLAHLPLEPFTEEEARDYLTRKGITDERVVEVVLGLSGRLPLLVATLAAESPDDPAKVGDPSGEAVERFLKWVKDPKQRQVALDAALPRRLNRDVLAVLVGEEEASVLFAWLRGMPFVEKRGDGWAYHEVVRAQMLRFKQQESPQGWAGLHGQLAAYYEELRDSLALEKEIGRNDNTWQTYALEALYHHLCRAPHLQLPQALNGFVAALEAQRDFARRWAKVVNQVGEDAEAPSVYLWGQRLLEGLTAYEEDRLQAAAEMFTVLLEQAHLETEWCVAALGYRGRIYHWMDRCEKALADFNRAIGLDPDNVWVIVRRGLIHRRSEHYEESLADFDRAIELDPSNAWPIGIRGETYQRMRRYEEALTDFNRAIELNPDDTWAMARRAETFRWMENYEEILTDLRRAIELDPDNPWTLARRGDIYRKMHRHEEALADLNRSIELKSNNAWAIACRGRTYREIDRTEDALADYNRAIELDPDNAWAIACRGEIYREMGRYEDALADYNHAVELNPDDTWAIAGRGFTYQLMNRYDKALADYNRAIELDPNNTFAIEQRRRVYLKMRCYEEALADFSRAIEQSPNDARLLAPRGLIYQRLERYEEALADYNRAIELNPDYAWAIAGRGETYQRMGRYEESLTDFDQAIELNPNNDWAIASRGKIYRLMGRCEEALTDFDRAIKLDPDNTWAIASRGETYRRMGHYEEALADLDRSVELDADYTWAIAGRGETYRLMGCYEEALADFNQAIELDPEYTWAIAHCGLTHQLMGHYEEARTKLAAAIEAVRARYEEEPQEWPNTLNLALYNLAAGRAEESERLYREALSSGASLYHVREAVFNLDDLLSLFPDHPQARAMRDLLQERLREAE